MLLRTAITTTNFQLAMRIVTRFNLNYIETCERSNGKQILKYIICGDKPKVDAFDKWFSENVHLNASSSLEDII